MKPREQRLEEAKNYLCDQYREGGDSPWLEGWICGVTDSESPLDDDARVEMLELLDNLRSGIM